LIFRFPDPPDQEDSSLYPKTSFILLHNPAVTCLARDGLLSVQFCVYEPYFFPFLQQVPGHYDLPLKFHEVLLFIIQKAGHGII
jgi:hypothetical protein